MKFGRVLFEILKRTDRQTNRLADTLITVGIFRTPSPYKGQSKNNPVSKN